MSVGHVRWFRTLTQFLACSRFIKRPVRDARNRPRNDLNLCHLRRRSLIKRNCQ
ncbi:MAG TPA: hypothetical protein VNO35_27940 [Steroidobacteraceae bacterium]|nr:hypothetical protein [Steroidobacteraceae bacterium]